jgi:RimK-like ATP-grasp domain
MKIRIYSGRPSEGAAFLAQEAGFIRLRTGKFNQKGDVIVNWGNVGAIPGVLGCHVLNKQDAVSKAINKKKTFEVLAAHSIQTVPWTANMAVAKEWLQAGRTVVARKTLTGHEGAGIIIVEKVNELIQASLYTQYIFKVREFRVHATPFGVIDTQQKVHDTKLGPPKSWKVRSYQNGFIFQRKGIIPNKHRDQLAIATIRAIGLDFGGLDIIEDKQGNFYVVEVNTAPGIEGSTVGLYGNALRDLSARITANPAKYRDDTHPAGVGVGGAVGGAGGGAYGAGAKADNHLPHPGPARPGLRPIAKAFVVNLNRFKWVA